MFRMSVFYPKQQDITLVIPGQMRYDKREPRACGENEPSGLELRGHSFTPGDGILRGRQDRFRGSLFSLPKRRGAERTWLTV